jgi:hypothetical protein
VALRGDQAAQGRRHVVWRDASRVDERRVLDQLDHPAARRPRGAAALGVESGLDHALALDSDGDAHEVSAGGTAGRARVRPAGQRSSSARGAEVVLEQHRA